MMQIVGMKVEKYIGKAVNGHNCDFEYTDSEFQRHILFAITDKNKKLKITLWHEEGECGSGWTTASFGHISVEEVSQFGGYTYVPKGRLIVDDLDPNDDYDFADINNSVFNVSYDGGDSYYPGGWYGVDVKLFMPTPRVKDKRPVWLFTGDSNLGKSYIASHTGLIVYETDSNSILPDSITADIIVLGKKYNFTIEEVKDKIFGEFELCVVNFNLYNSYNENIVANTDKADSNVKIDDTEIFEL
jgi:hypothetical protein